MKVESVTATPVEFPLKRPLALLGGATPSFTNVLIAVRTSDGVVGYGEATPRPKLNGETVRSVMAAVESVLRQSLVDREVHGHQGIVAAMRGLVDNACAKAGVEAAALDALGRSLGVACYTLLGGYATSVRCSGLLPLGDSSEVIKTAEGMRARYGISAFKLKVGADLERDCVMVRELRREFPDALLLADANQGFSPSDALAFIRVAEAEGLEMVEEPTRHQGAEVLQRLTAASFIDIVGDESCRTTVQAIAALASRTFSGVSIKVGRTGLAGSAQIRDRADQLGARGQIGYEMISSVGAAASLGFAASAVSTSAHPSEAISFLEVTTDIVTAPLRITEGFLAVPSGPGFGVDVDEQAVERLRAG